MRFLSFALASALLLAPSVAQERGGTRLHEPKSGATVTLPKGWSFAAHEDGLLAASDDKQASVLLIGSDRDFGAVARSVDTVLSELVFRDVQVERATVIAEENRGGLEGLIAATGTAIDRADGSAVAFRAMIVKVGDSGEIILGAWKQVAQRRVVHNILESLHFEHAGGTGGLVLSDTSTGASIQLPDQWRVLSSHRGLLAVGPERKGMTMILRPQDDFEASVRRARKLLGEWVFQDVVIGDFAVVEASYDKAFGEIVAASGKAVDRVDKKPVEMRVLSMERVDLDRGVLIFGAWKDPKTAEQVRGMLDSIQVAKK